MVEFALILPILLLLTFGTLEIGLYLQRRLVLGGATFCAARAAAVQGPKAGGAAKSVLTTYASDAQAQWIAQAAGSTKVQGGDRQLQVSVTRTGDMWTGLLTGSVQLTGGRLDPIAKWQAMTPISQEFVPGDSGRHAGRSQTDLMVDYRAKLPWAGLMPDFSGMLDKLPPGLVPPGADLRLALNPAEQAAMANPMNRSGSTSPSKLYVGPTNESKEFRHAGKLENGLVMLRKGVVGFYAIYAGASVPGAPPIDKGLEAVATAFFEADKRVKFAETSDKLEDGMHAFFLARKPKR